ncbi:hypothetical protein C487_03358 [Natrinema pallidum DSM 3751]|uniref:Uncharacterized protein n=1 Tax=Natrinema pallidum DSM 3751 TaxID=1227495 RepID=L9Z7D1_9EURY|nr:hypothetical protein C487_03358 [Natrinema pallidum DSM 3751]
MSVPALPVLLTSRYEATGNAGDADRPTSSLNADRTLPRFGRRISREETEVRRPAMGHTRYHSSHRRIK